MMGPKKLSEIRRELKESIVATGKDPLEWLEEQMAASRKKESGNTEVLDALRELLREPIRPRKRKTKAGAKKGS